MEIFFKQKRGKEKVTIKLFLLRKKIG